MGASADAAGSREGAPSCPTPLGAEQPNGGVPEGLGEPPASGQATTTSTRGNWTHRGAWEGRPPTSQGCWPQARASWEGAGRPTAQQEEVGVASKDAAPNSEAWLGDGEEGSDEVSSLRWVPTHPPYNDSSAGSRLRGSDLHGSAMQPLIANITSARARARGAKAASGFEASPAMLGFGGGK
eukprot:14349125-Alexandrium_andersonii.AAC.1